MKTVLCMYVFGWGGSMSWYTWDHTQAPVGREQHSTGQECVWALDGWIIMSTGWCGEARHQSDVGSHRQLGFIRESLLAKPPFFLLSSSSPLVFQLGFFFPPWSSICFRSPPQYHLSPFLPPFLLVLHRLTGQISNTYSPLKVLLLSRNER